MKFQTPDTLPTQDLLLKGHIAVMPLEAFVSDLSSVPHRHDAYQLILVQETKGGDNLIDFRRYEMTEGRLFLIGPEQAHQRQSRQERGVLVFFSEAFLQTTGITAHDALVLFGAVYQHPYLDLKPELQQIFLQLTALISLELRQPEPSQAILSRYLFILLNYLLRECHVQIAQLTPARHSERLFRLSSLIEEHFQQHKPVSFYAEALDITPKHLNSLCRQYLHTTVADMQNARLLLESKRLLYFSSLSVKEVAYQLGFEDDSYFVRFFRRMTGTTPLQFRASGSKSTIAEV
ncbi:helix-turn-helix domain-containing protein [Pontibacter sp. BT310]|uniref:AraC family transcriptional regulator n=1 Tax=Pontibacter populi TaxID=890055 RepID=A0ABS6XF26_9BACT|nr:MULTISPECIES: AraC family transcriptional regulator [Pontibacter]MBJ6119712.1 helix-turn-helix domain-containing protein [Pontibacter sp. BT310]MBR0572141.1 helix-turn-helix domain-containing protein [Microvirga sp. STS03]MBW3366565.1 AraC family transcriptional regulator [Pontibacter populi]